MITIGIFSLALLIGMPIVMLLVLASVVFLWEFNALILLDSLAVQAVSGIEKNGFLAIPLYMLVGEIMHRGGITERLVQVAGRMVGRLRGGLAYVNLLTNAFAAAILGSATAQIAIMSKSLVPTMTKRGYDPHFSTGLTICAGLLGPIIPPSMLMIIYGVLAYQSVATLFIAGLIPGLLIASVLALVIALHGKRLPKEEASDLAPISKKQLLVDLLPGTIPLTIITGVVTGATTPTEAGAVACMIAFLLSAIVYRSLKLSDIPDMLLSVALASAGVIALIGFATFFGWVVSYEGLPDLFAEWVGVTATSPFMFLLLVSMVVFFLGMFLDGIGVMIVLVPILLPVAERFNVDPIHFGVVIAIATLTGLVTPPVGPGLFIAMQATGLSMWPLFRASLPFLAAFFTALVAISALPILSTWLPRMLGM